MGDMTSLVFVQMLRLPHQEVILWSMFDLCKYDVSFVFTLTDCIVPRHVCGHSVLWMDAGNKRRVYRVAP